MVKLKLLKGHRKVIKYVEKMPVLHTYSFSSIYSNIISPSTVFYLQCLFDSSNFSNQLRRFFQDYGKREIVSNISYVETFELKQQFICYLVNIIELLIVLLDSICRHIVYTVKY